MVTILNTDRNQQVWWYAVPKFSADISQALFQGMLNPSGRDSCNPDTTVNIIFALGGGDQIAALCEGGVDTVVVFYNPSFGAWATCVAT